MKSTTRRARPLSPDEMMAETGDWIPSHRPDRDLAAALDGAPVFAGMDRHEVEHVVAAFDEVRFPSGRRVVLEGWHGSDFFLIVAGSASVLIDGWRVATLGPGDVFGEIAVLDEGVRSASVRAETPLHCLVLANGRLAEVLVDHPAMSVNLLRLLAGRLRGMTGHRDPESAGAAG